MFDALLRHPRVNTLWRWLAARSVRTIALLTTGGVLLVGLLDRLTGDRLAMGMLYAVPIIIGTWHGSGRLGHRLAWFSSLLWMVGSAPRSAQWLIGGWNIFVGVLFFHLIAALFLHLRRAFVGEARLAHTDPLTGALNRRAFHEALAHLLAVHQRFQLPFTVATLDLDNFKAVNDTGGHLVGDQVLQIVVQTLQTALRTTDHVARVGGDEFWLLFPHTPTETIQPLIERLQIALDRAFATGQWATSASMGVVHVERDAPEARILIGVADLLLYRVKAQGKHGVAYACWPLPPDPDAPPADASGLLSAVPPIFDLHPV